MLSHKKLQKGIRYDTKMKNDSVKVVALVIGPKARVPLTDVVSVIAVAGKGLRGDRYYMGKGSFNAPQFDPSVREVTLIAIEAIDICNKKLDSELNVIDFRRNIVTQGMNLEQLKGKRFQIGSAVFRYVRSAPPCRYLSRLLGEDMMLGLRGIGGIRAVIEKSGQIDVGDEIHVLP